MKNNVYAVVLAGGKGTRLWPLSTEKYSKSFVSIGKSRPPVEDCIGRLAGLINRENIIIVVDRAQARILRKFTKGIPGHNILVEPFGKSTASAVGLAAINLKHDDIMVVLPTDALIKDPAPFRKTLKRAIDFATTREDALLCVGIKPKRPSTSYGYIKTGRPKEGGIYSVDKFIEKPDDKKAAEFIKRGNYLWNVGMFIFKANNILKAMGEQSPILYNALLRIKRNKKEKKAAYRRMKNVSIDYQIMEKAKNLYCVKGNFSWCDLGNWRSAEELFGKDKEGNVVFGKATLVDTRDSIVYNSAKEKLGLIGLNDVIAVRTGAGTLLCGKKDAERVKELVKKL